MKTDDSYVLKPTKTTDSNVLKPREIINSHLLKQMKTDDSYVLSKEHNTRCKRMKYRTQNPNMAQERGENNTNKHRKHSN